MCLVNDLAMALDPAVWARGQLGLDPDPWQADVLRSSSTRILLNCARQTGKSTVTAVLALHSALFRPESLVLLLSPSLRQSGELFKLVSGCYHQLAEAVTADAESALRIELENGSRVVSLPGKERTVRGYSGVDLLVIDEAARVGDDLYLSVRPILAVSGGRLIPLSTPFGKRGWWFHEWAEGGEGWYKVRVTAPECPRISSEFLGEERRDLGEWWFQQEYECEFMHAQTAAFSYDAVMGALVEEVEIWNM